MCVSSRPLVGNTSAHCARGMQYKHPGMGTGSRYGPRRTLPPAQVTTVPGVRQTRQGPLPLRRLLAVAGGGCEHVTVKDTAASPRHPKPKDTEWRLGVQGGPATRAPLQGPTSHPHCVRQLQEEWPCQMTCLERPECGQDPWS